MMTDDTNRGPESESKSGDPGLSDTFSDSGSSDFESAFHDEETDEPLQNDRQGFGIRGLDASFAGIDPGSTVAIIGDPGTNMTTLALQFLNQGLANGEQVALLSPGKSPARLCQQADDYGWEFTAAYEEGQLRIPTLNTDPDSNRRSAITQELDRLADTDIERLAIPDFDLYERLFESRRQRIQTVTALLQQLQGEISTVLSAQIEQSDPARSQFRTVERLSDLVFQTRVRKKSTRTLTSISILKATQQSKREESPYELRDDGITVYDSANPF